MTRSIHTSSLYRTAVVVGSVVLLASAAHASGTEDWLLTLAPSPLGRAMHAMAYDSARDRMVLFGGGDLVVFGDTWEWDGNNWIRRTPDQSPPARWAHAMVYDSARERVVLFGGTDGTVETFADTWEWDGNNWVERTPPTGPPARYGHAMAYDSLRGRVVLFGGGDHVVFGDTWEWDGSTWIERAPATSPPASYRPAMAYDSARGRVVLARGGATFETWEWDGSNWVKRTPATTPSRPGRREFAMAYDSSRERVVLFGGYGSPYLDDTWEWNGDNWIERTPPKRPSRRSGHAMAYDVTRGSVVVFGGEYQSHTNDAWEWDGSTWSERERTSGPSSRVISAMAYDGARGRVVLFGGRDPTFDDTDDTWELGRNGWIKRVSSTSPPAREGHAMAYDGARGRVVLFGGSSPPLGTYLGDTWEWDGSTWIERTPATSPSARDGHAMAYDSGRGRVVLFGGNAGTLGDTWEWDGNAWIESATATSPPARAGHAMAYDGARGRVVLFGGGSESLGYLGDTWEWDGNEWVQRSPATSPPGRSYGAMVYDSARQRIVLFGGYGPSDHLADTWEWDGSEWIERTPATAVPARAAHSMAYVADRGRVILFGGGQFPDTYLGDMWEYGPIETCGHGSSAAAFTSGSGTADTSGSPAVGAPDGSDVSLGVGGSLEVLIEVPIPNGPGADLIVHEVGSSDGGLDDSYRVEVSEDGIVYLFASNCTGDDCQLDVGGSGVSNPRYVKLVDLPPDDGEPAPRAGADIDALSVVACDACGLIEGGADGDGDGIANGCDDCPELATSTQTDTDGDGAGDACDCAPADPLARPAAEVEGLAVEKLGAGAARLSWNPSAGAATYAVIRGEISALSSTLGDCAVGELAGLEWDDAELPQPGEGFTYLVRGESAACGPGPLGFGAFGAPRVHTGGACP